MVGAGLVQIHLVMVRAGIQTGFTAILTHDGITSINIMCK
jgi:hypothetical protein